MLSNKLAKQALKYDTLSDKEKEIFISKAYNEENVSYRIIADAVGTYQNKIRRDALKFGIESKSKSEAQAIALDTGRHKHPTKGTIRDEETKIKISERRSEVWDNITDEERQRLSDVGKVLWDKKTDEQKDSFRKASTAAIQKASKEGSKLEKYLQQELLNAGFKVEFHKEQTLQNQRLQIDLWMPDLATAIEVDGPSHFSPIWGQKAFDRNQKSDNQKTGLILGAGCVMVRVKQAKNLSQKFQRDILKELIETLEGIKTKYPPQGKRNIILGDD